MISNEDQDIKAAINAVAAFSAGQYKRDLIRRMTDEVQEEVMKARLDGKPIDTTDLFKTLANRYAN